MGSRTFFAAAVLAGWLVSSTGYAQELPDDTRFDSMYGAVELAQEEDGGDLLFTEPAVDGGSQEALPSAAICGYIGDVSGLGDAYGATVAAHVFANCALRCRSRFGFEFVPAGEPISDGCLFARGCNRSHTVDAGHRSGAWRRPDGA